MSAIAPNQVLDACDSTNDLARALIQAGAPHGSWISARQQMKGRGRQGRAWVSESGNLFLSMVFRAPEGSSAPLTWIPLVTALGVAEALEPEVSIHIKWPNDLWMVQPTESGFAKTGGILCESLGSPSGSAVVAGIGINCLRDPGNVGQAACALGLPVDEVRARVIQGVARAWDRLLREGAGWAADSYESRAVFRRGTAVGCAEFVGRADGLGPYGELQVRLAGGERKSVFAEDVNLLRLATN